MDDFCGRCADVEVAILSEEKGAVSLRLALAAPSVWISISRYILQTSTQVMCTCDGSPSAESGRSWARLRRTKAPEDIVSRVRRRPRHGGGSVDN